MKFGYQFIWWGRTDVFRPRLVLIFKLAYMDIEREFSVNFSMIVTKLQNPAWNTKYYEC